MSRPLSRRLLRPTITEQTGVFIPEKSNIWRDCCDGMLDWVKEHVLEVRAQPSRT